MSLINKMLLDLEARKDAPSVHGAKVVLDDLRPIMGARASARPRGPMVLAGLATVTVALAGVWYWQNTIFDGVTPPPVAQAPIPPISIAKPNEIAPVTSPAIAAQPVVAVPAAVVAATDSLPTPLPAAPVASASSVSTATAPAPVRETNTPAAVAVSPPSVIAAAPPAVITPKPAPPLASVDTKPKPKRATLPAPARVAAAAPIAPNESAEPVTPALIDKKPRVLSPAEQADQYYRNAVYELKQRRAQAAEADLRAALQHQPGHLKARELAVALMVERGRATEAVTVLQQGLEVAPRHAPFAHWLARIYADQAQDTKAVAVLEAAREQSAGDADVAGLLATLYQRGARHSDAIVSYRAALALKPGEARWWTGLGISLEAERQWRDAAQAYGRARETGTLTPALARYIDERLQSLNARRD